MSKEKIDDKEDLSGVEQIVLSNEDFDFMVQRIEISQEPTEKAKQAMSKFKKEDL